MITYKSIQELIIKAAFYDRITTTISPHVIDSEHILTITFSKNGRHSATNIDSTRRYTNHEEAILYACKRALMDVLFAPYSEIEVNKEN